MSAAGASFDVVLTTAAGSRPAVLTLSAGGLQVDGVAAVAGATVVAGADHLHVPLPTGVVRIGLPIAGAQSRRPSRDPLSPLWDRRLADLAIALDRAGVPVRGTRLNQGRIAVGLALLGLLVAPAVVVIEMAVLAVGAAGIDAARTSMPWPAAAAWWALAAACGAAYLWAFPLARLCGQALALTARLFRPPLMAEDLLAMSRWPNRLQPLTFVRSRVDTAVIVAVLLALPLVVSEAPWRIGFMVAYCVWATGTVVRGYLQARHGFAKLVGPTPVRTVLLTLAGAMAAFALLLVTGIAAID